MIVYKEGASELCLSRKSITLLDHYEAFLMRLKADCVYTTFL